jgi:hypothetical protein
LVLVVSEGRYGRSDRTNVEISKGETGMRVQGRGRHRSTLIGQSGGARDRKFMTNIRSGTAPTGQGMLEKVSGKV